MPEFGGTSAWNFMPSLPDLVEQPLCIRHLLAVSTLHSHRPEVYCDIEWRIFLSQTTLTVATFGASGGGNRAVFHPGGGSA